MRYLTFDLSDNHDGVTTIELMAATRATEHAHVIAEVDDILAWAWTNFPHTHGPAEDGNDWNHDLQVTLEPGDWHAVTLTLTASPDFEQAFKAQFDQPEG